MGTVDDLCNAFAPRYADQLELAPDTRDALLGGTARRVFTRLP